MIVIRQKEFKRGDTDRLDLNLLGKVRYNKEISNLAGKIKEDKKRYSTIKPSSIASTNDNSIFNSHKLNLLLKKSGARRKEVEDNITSNPWNQKGAIPKYLKQLVSINN